MNWYDLIFFHVFKLYYKDGAYRRDNPPLTASVILGMSSFVLVVALLMAMDYLFVSHEKMVIGNQKPLFITVGMVFVGFNYLLFRRRFKNIYNKYRYSSYDNWKYRLVAFLYIVLAFFSAPLAALTIDYLK